MAQARPCPQCGERHFNFQKCRVRENKRSAADFSKLIPKDPGLELWRQDHLDEFENRGGMVIRTAPDMRLKPHAGKLIEPKEN
jgi:hypothetical protein